MTNDYNSLRFGPDYTDQFPEVIGYDYEDNLYTRGLSDTLFRWAETYILSDYLLREATTGGSFEQNSLSGSPTTGAVVLSNPSTIYSGWTAYGENVYHIGTSGSYFSSLDKWAYPIVTNQAVMLYPSGSSCYITQTGITTGQSGMPFDRHFQLYLVARALSGTGYITPYISSRISAAEEAYYDFVSDSWSLSVPTGKFQVDSAGYTEILYDFYTSNISGSTPDNYAVTIYTSNSDYTPVIIDDVHIDEILARNPFLDYILPTGYLVQITPDLGWHDIKDMFDGETNRNPHLKSFGLFAIEAGNLEDKLDGSVLATVDASDFSSAVLPHYKRYLWRAVAVGPNGQLGTPGLPQYFEYIGSIFDSEFTVDTIVQDPLSTVRIVKGKKPLRAVILIDGEQSEQVTYTSNTSWVYTVYMDREEKNIAIKAQDPGGATSSTKYLKLQCKLYDSKSLPVWNTFDDHGLMMDLERIDNESNKDFYTRIKDVIRSPAGSTFAGIVNGAARELGIDRIADAITIEISKNSNLVKKKISVDVELVSNSLRVRTEFFVTSQTCIVDPVHNYVVLDYYPRAISEVRTEEGLVISDDLYKIEVEKVSGQVDRRYRVVFKTNDYKGTIVKVKYEYFKEALLKDYRTIYDIVLWLRNLTDNTGSTFLTVTVNKRLSGGESSRGLYKTNLIVRLGNSRSIDWSPIFLDRISDPDYKLLFEGQGKQLYETEYYESIKKLQSLVRVFWGNVECDRDYWGISESVSQSMDYVPTVCDPIKSKFIEKQTTGYIELSSPYAWSTSYRNASGEATINIGLTNKYFQPGVGYKNDLKTEIQILNYSGETPNIRVTPSGPKKNNNSFIYFSGQR